MAAWPANSLRAASSSSVKSPPILFSISNAPNNSPCGERRGTHSRLRVSKPSLRSTRRSTSRCASSRSTRRGSPLWITWPTTPASSGNRSSPSWMPSAGRPTSVRLALSQRKMLARSAANSCVEASAICCSNSSVRCVWFQPRLISRIFSRRSIRRRPRSRCRTAARPAPASRPIPGSWPGGRRGPRSCRAARAPPRFRIEGPAARRPRLRRIAASRGPGLRPAVPAAVPVSSPPKPGTATCHVPRSAGSHSRPRPLPATAATPSPETPASVRVLPPATGSALPVDRSVPGLHFAWSRPVPMYSV